MCAVFLVEEARICRQERIVALIKGERVLVKISRSFA
jgi:hypothetical protein